MVTIIDPHLKADDGFKLFAEAKDAGLLVRTADNSSHFEGDCWPGRSGWLDYLQPAARAFWARRFAADAYGGSTEHLYTWNDMNEPSVFDGPEITMAPTLRHRTADGGEVEHREVHNLYGMLMTMATHQGQHQAYPARRPFVLTRAFFAGSQRHAAVWTGDNRASWSHLGATTRMLLSLSVAGIPFVGADVGGFFGNPQPELLVRWYQAAVFHPFFRAHAEFQTKRREPWLFGESVTAQVRTALRLRYALLPYLYTLFAEHAAEAPPPMRPLWWHFPSDGALLGNAWWGGAAAAEPFLLGDAILVQPIATPGCARASVYLPAEPPTADALWYHLHTLAPTPATPARRVLVAVVAVGADAVPAFLRGGAILARRDRPRRSSAQTHADAFTLVVAPDVGGAAAGRLPRRLRRLRARGGRQPHRRLRIRRRRPVSTLSVARGRRSGRWRRRRRRSSACSCSASPRRPPPSASAAVARRTPAANARRRRSATTPPRRC